MNHTNESSGTGLISFYRNYSRTKSKATYTVEKFIDLVQDHPKWRADILKLRTLPAAEYKAAKLQLPSVTLSSSAGVRGKDDTSDDKHSSHSGYMQLDFDADKGNDGMTLDEIKAAVQQSPYARYGFDSPSGKGYKVIAMIPPCSPAQQLATFESLVPHFHDLGVELDPQVKSQTMLCFVSHDPVPFDNRHAETVPLVEVSEDEQPAIDYGFESLPDDIDEKMPGTNDDIELVKAALDRIAEADANGELRRLEWLLIYSGVMNAYGAAGCDLLDEHLPLDGDAGVNSYHQLIGPHCDEKVSLPKVFAAAKEFGFDQPAARQQLERVQAAEQRQSLFDDAKPDDATFITMGLDDLEFDPVDKDLIEGLLQLGTCSVVYGAPGTAKTFWTLDACAHIAAGIRWRESCDVEQGAALYFGLEGAGGLRDRLLGLRDHGVLKDHAGAPLRYSDQPLSLLDPADVKKLVVTVKQLEVHHGEPFRIVVLDTLSRASAGGDENSSTDMTKVTQAVTDILAALPHVHVCLVHHSGKDTSRGMRGHSSLLGAMDTVIHLERDKDDQSVIFATPEKQKDLEIQPPKPFKLETIKVGTTNKGKDRTTCIIRQDYESTPAKQGSSKKAKPGSGKTNIANKVGTALQRLAKSYARAANGAGDVQAEDWRIAWDDLGYPVSEAAIRKARSEVAKFSERIDCKVPFAGGAEKNSWRVFTPDHDGFEAGMLTMDDIDGWLAAEPEADEVHGLGDLGDVDEGTVPERS